MVKTLVTANLDHQEYEDFKVFIGKKKISVALRELIQNYNEIERKKVEAPNDTIPIFGTSHLCILNAEATHSNNNNEHSTLKAFTEIDPVILEQYDNRHLEKIRSHCVTMSIRSARIKKDRRFKKW
jgi:hypothetical protein